MFSLICSSFLILLNIFKVSDIIAKGPPYLVRFVLVLAIRFHADLKEGQFLFKGMNDNFDYFILRSDDGKVKPLFVALRIGVNSNIEMILIILLCKTPTTFMTC